MPYTTDERNSPVDLREARNTIEIINADATTSTYRLNDWEQRFVDDMNHQVNIRGYAPTAKQLWTLRTIKDKVIEG